MFKYIQYKLHNKKLTIYTVISKKLFVLMHVSNKTCEWVACLGTCWRNIFFSAANNEYEIESI